MDTMQPGTSKTTPKNQGANRTRGARALRFQRPGGGVAFAWRSAAGWQVRSEDDALRDRICAALSRPTIGRRTHTEPDGERVLDGWEEVDPADVRYPVLFLLQFSRMGLDGLSVDLVPRAQVEGDMTVHSLA